MDIECYRDYFLVMFKAPDTGRVRAFEMYDGQPLDKETVVAILKTYQVVTFNGMDYDMPILMYALRGADCAELKAASDHIILQGLRGWQFEQAYGVKVPSSVDHIDLKEPVPGGQISLKLYGGRLHSKRLQELPYDPDASIGPAERAELVRYCENDLDTTIDLWNKARDPKDDIIGTRELLTAEFGVDVRSKSDAQIAEAIIRARVEKMKGERIYRTEVRPGTRFTYRPPAWLRYKSPTMQAVFGQVCAAEFIVQGDGTVAMPEVLNASIPFGRSIYRMGIGGLHSSEKSQAVIGSDQTLVRDVDVVSYYPAMILQCGLFPENMGEHFQRVFQDFFTRRVSAKKAGHKSTAQTLKIFLNGTFGKLGSPYSVLYAPNLMIQVTVTGQLALLMLIERFEMAGIPVVSANTDGVVQACPAHLDGVRQQIIKQWEHETGFETEETVYRALFSRDVNNYVALKAGGGVKTKGVLADPGVMKNPANVIVSHAVCDYLDKGVPLAQTIIGCTDIRKFLTVKRVTGGAQMPVRQELIDDWVNVERGLWVRAADSKTKERRVSRPAPVLVTTQATYLGKVVRWYRSTRSRHSIEYVKNGNRVASSENAMPLMELPDSMPTDIDYDFYINEARDLLREIGAV